MQSNGRKKPKCVSHHVQRKSSHNSMLVTVFGAHRKAREILTNNLVTCKFNEQKHTTSSLNLRLHLISTSLKNDTHTHTQRYRHRHTNTQIDTHTHTHTFLAFQNIHRFSPLWYQEKNVFSVFCSKLCPLCHNIHANSLML